MTEQDKLKSDIRKLLKDKDAIMVAHNYQRDEVQEIADFAGDSLGLSRIAAESDAKVIVFCGVHFMAESAAILAPEKKVLLPRLDAGCPMADMITAEDIMEEREKRPNAAIVAYVNTTAEVKAHSDICCTSANAVSIVNAVESDEVFMIPDRNLAQWVKKSVLKTRPTMKMDYWDGFCPTHEYLTPEDVTALKKRHPDAAFMAHPECNPAVVDMADHVCSTSGMYTYAEKSPAKTFIVATENGILYRLRRDNPEKEFFLASEAMICPNMKLINLEDIIVSLENMSGRVTVEEDIRIKAKVTLDKMLAVHAS